MPLEIQIEPKNNKNKNSKVSKVKSCKGLIFCFTGESAQGYVRDDLVDFLEEAGGVYKNSITQKTNYLVVFEKPGIAKKNKAKRYGIPIITESDFWKFIGKPKVGIDRLLAQNNPPNKKTVGDLVKQFIKTYPNNVVPKPTLVDEFDDDDDYDGPTWT